MVVVSAPAHGSLNIGANGAFTYVHDGSETTSDTFTYRVNDGTADSNVATVAINELVGPILFKLAIDRSGESSHAPEELRGSKIIVEGSAATTQQV